MEIIIESLDKRFNKHISYLRRLIKKVLLYLGIKNRSLEIVLVSSQTMDKNVLSFLSPNGFPGSGYKHKYLGIIYLNPDYIKKTGGDLTFMAVHGLLHLLGYDHKRKNDIIKMKTQEMKIMKRLGSPK